MKMLGGLLSLVLCLACAHGVEVSGASPGCGVVGPPTTAAALRDCVKLVGFDTLEAAGDKQALTVITSGQGEPCPGSKDLSRGCQFGPIATIQPESTSHNQKIPNLREGRIIARLFLNDNKKQRYDSLALVPGDTTYWWVQVTKGTDREIYSASKKDSVGISVFISTAVNPDGSPITKTYPLNYVSHKDKFKQSLARWVWDPDDEKTQGSCGQGCCR
jgi:hypothetical protein